MVKKLSVIAKRFSKAQKDARAAAKVQREAMLNGTILTPECLMLLTEGPCSGVSFAVLDDVVIAEVSVYVDRVSVEFADGKETEVQFQNVDACKSLLTYRKVAVANMLPNGAVNLANMVRQKDAEAEAMQLRACTDSQSSAGQTQVRLSARL